jgi:alkylation response protein AidB-like acyl-CoA dehydrogenase
MNDYTTEEMFIIETARKFAQKRLALISSLIDEEGQWHADTIREMGEIGLMGTIIPEKYGGCFQSYRAYYGAIKEIASVSGSHALTSGILKE